MKQFLNALNIDDTIREIKRLFRNLEFINYEINIYWGKYEYNLVLDFIEATMGCGLGLFNDINIKVMAKCIKKHNHRPKKEGFYFMGVRHFKSKENINFAIKIYENSKDKN